jgi:hypothetical protein
VGGAPDALLRTVMMEVIELLLDDIGARRLQALQSARALPVVVDRLKGMGYSGGELVRAACTRLGICERTYYRRRAKVLTVGVSSSAVRSGRSP